MPYQRGEGKTVVIALGGNALGNTPQEQLELVKNTAAHIVDMIEDGTNVVVSHGNGPQVGMINNAFAYASANDGKTPEMPFPEAGAMSQGYIGYQLSQAILNELKARGILRSTVNVDHPDGGRPGRPGLPEPHQAGRRLPHRGGGQGQGRRDGLDVQGGRRAGAGGRSSPAPSRCASSSSTPSATSWTPATSSSPRAAAGCRCSRRAATRACPRSSTRTARARFSPASSAPTCSSSSRRWRRCA